jgi:riboflavin kinase/FMN adenylyltransferase
LICTVLALDNLPDLEPCAVAIGNFDGVHLGHRKILEETRAVADQHGLQAVVLTFDPHPMKIVAPERLPKLLTTPAQRLPFFEQCGFDRTVILDFTPRVAQLTAEQFTSQVLAGRLHARWIVVGENFRFGHRGAGNIAVLRQLGEQYGFRAVSVEPVRIGGEAVSSTRVRRLLSDRAAQGSGPSAVGQGSGLSGGRIAQVRKLLGRPFVLEGPIVPGHGVGARQTVPTLNLQPEAELWPARGVYITSTREPSTGRCWESVTNIGSRPTFNGAEQTVETFLLSPFEGPTPHRIELAFHWRLRDEKKFDSAESLRHQILIDAARAKRFFRVLAISKQIGSRAQPARAEPGS